MKRSEFASALQKQTEVHVSSGLRQKTLDAAYGKEKMMKKKKIKIQNRKILDKFPVLC